MNYKTRKGFAWNFFQRIENIFISIQYLPVSISLASFIPLISISENIEQRCLVPPFGIYHSEKNECIFEKKGGKNGYGSSPKVQERVSGGRKIMRCATISKGWASMKSQAKLT